jgi:iron complex outermembrane recepter protein
VTHEGGEFHLTDLPTGRVTILFERLGYRRVVRELDLGPGQTVELRIEMHTSAIELPGIVVTGMTRAGLGDQTVRPASVLSGQELARRMDVTLAATRCNEPGLSGDVDGARHGRPVIRGLGGDRVLMLEDGARVGDLSSASSDHALSVEPLNAERIEVVRGPAALLYGSNAIGGVINVIRDEIPTTVPDRANGTVSLQGQSVNDALAGGASLHTAAGPLALSGSGSYRNAGDLSTPAGTLENTDLRTYSLAAGASRVTPRGHLGAAYRYYDNDYGVPGGFVGSHPEGVRIEMRRHSIHGQAQLHRPVGPFSSIEADGKYTNYHHRELEDEGIIGTEYGLLSAAGEVTARHGELGRLTSGALGARIDWEDFAAGGSTQTPPSRSWTAAIYALEELGLGPIRLQAGGRLDWHRIEPLETTTARDIGEVRTRTFASIAASIGALYSLREGLSIGASLARAYRTPDTNELFSQGPHLAAYSYEVGNPDLDAEVGVGVDVFLRARQDRFNAEVAAFRNMLRNYIYYRDTGATSPTGLPVYQASGADALLQGFELSATAEPLRNFVLSGTLSHVRGSFTDSDEPLPMIPPVNGQLSARYERARFFVGAGVRAAAEQERIAEFEMETPGYSVLDVEGGVRWLAFGRMHSVTARVENVTDAVVYDHLSRIRDRETDRRAAGPSRGASVVYRVVF